MLDRFEEMCYVNYNKGNKKMGAKDKVEIMERNVKTLFNAVEAMQTNILVIVERVETLTAHVNTLDEAEEERKRAEG